MQGWKPLIRYMMKRTGCTYKQGEAFILAQADYYADMEEESSNPDRDEWIEVPDEEFDAKTEELVRIISEQTGINRELVSEMDSAFMEFLDKNKEDIKNMNEFLENNQNKISFLINAHAVVWGIFAGTIIHMILRMVW